MQTDETWHEPARRPVGSEPDARVRHHELRRLPGDHEIGRADESEPGARRAAVHRGHHRSVTADQRGDRRVERGNERTDVRGELVAQRLERLDVTATAEPGAVAREEDHTDAVVQADRSGRRHQVARQAVVDAVGGLWPVEREVGDPVAHLEQHVLISHGRGCYESAKKDPARWAAGGILEGLDFWGLDFGALTFRGFDSSVRAGGPSARSGLVLVLGHIPVRSGWAACC